MNFKGMRTASCAISTLYTMLYRSRGYEILERIAPASLYTELTILLEL